MVARRAFTKTQKKMRIGRKMIGRGMRKNSLAPACERKFHFRRFSQSMKIYGKVDPKSRPKSFERALGPWGGQGGFIDHFY